MENQNKNENQNGFESFNQIIDQNLSSEAIDSINELRVLLLEIQKKISLALELLSGRTVKGMPVVFEGLQTGRVIEGVFDGQHMIGQDGKEYLVPPNYASKSKLVEGDILKLTITGSGAFIYKQIGPIARSRAVGVLARNESNEYTVQSGGTEWKVIPAAVSFFKGEPGDEVVILVPQNTPSKWAAVENIIKNTN